LKSADKKNQIKSCFNFYAAYFMNLFLYILQSAKKQLRKIYQDVLTLNKKSKLSLTSIKDILNIRELVQHRRTSLRKQMFQLTQKFRRSKSETIYNFDDAMNDTASNSAGECSLVKNNNEVGYDVKS